MREKSTLAIFVPEEPVHLIHYRSRSGEEAVLLCRVIEAQQGVRIESIVLQEGRNISGFALSRSPDEGPVWPGERSRDKVSRSNSCLPIFCPACDLIALCQRLD